MYFPFTKDQVPRTGQVRDDFMAYVKGGDIKCEMIIDTSLMFQMLPILAPLHFVRIRSK